MAKGVLKFKNTDVARQSGELARVRVIFGTDQGAIHVITVPKATIGRGEDNEILLPDLKASRKHAEFIFDGAQWGLKDLGSANGLLVNGQLTRQTLLRSGDHIQVGESVVEFLNGEASTQMLKAPIKEVQQIQQEHAVLNQHRAHVRSLGTLGGASSTDSSPEASAKKKKFKMIAIAVIGIVGLMLFLDDPPKGKKGKKKKDEVKERDLASYMPDAEYEALNKTAAPFMREGLRELRERNFLRARLQFETVLQMAPGHPLATLLLQNSITAIDDEIKRHLERAKKTEDIGKLRESRSHYEAVLRLLYRDQANPHYIEAKENLEKVNKLMKSSGDGGST